MTVMISVFRTVFRLCAPAIVMTVCLAPTALSAATYYVSTTGSDKNAGTSADRPWRTIQKAASMAAPGSTVYVRGGTYSEAVTVGVSGSAADGYVTFRNYPGETPVIDGSSLIVPATDNGLFLIVDKSYIAIQGFELRNYRTSVKGIVPVGIFVSGSAHHIALTNNKIHAIEHNGTSSTGTDAHGIAVYGTSGTQASNNIVIDGNELYALKLGSSESMVLNGNVDTFRVTNNIIHDNNNIGIDAAGFEGAAPANDQARNGLIACNHIYNIDSYGNVAYGTDRAADGIYVDGGRDIVIERNRVHNCNIGIEVASEHAGRAASGVTVRNNFIYRNHWTGIAIGGYDKLRGSTQNCAIVNNTLFQNDSLNWHYGELCIQYDTRSTAIENNIVSTTSGNPMIYNDFTENTNNLVDHNLYYSPDGASRTTWRWKKVVSTGLAAYQASSSNDAHSLFADPLFVSASIPDIHLRAQSPAINAGILVDSCGSIDFDGDRRVNGTIDLGADEWYPVTDVSLLSPSRAAEAGMITNYPNPFNPLTQIVFRATLAAWTTVRIVDALGRQAAMLYQGVPVPGLTYVLRFDGSMLSSATYFMIMTNGTRTTVGRMMLVK